MLIENPGAEQRLNHLGIEAPTPDLGTAALARFQGAGLATTLAEQDVCCHAIRTRCSSPPRTGRSLGASQNC